jgi:hypothetical protein
MVILFLAFSFNCHISVQTNLLTFSSYFSIRSERDFNKREMEQAFEMVEKLKKSLAGNGQISAGNGNESTQVGFKRPPIDCSQSVPKKAKYSANIDE